MAVGHFFSACQSSTSDSNDPPASERTSVVVKYSITDSTPQKVADSVTWNVGQSSGAGIAPVLESRQSDNVSYSASLSLSSPIGSQTLVLSLWKCGVRIGRLSYTATGTTGELTLTDKSAVYDNLALSLLKTLTANGGTPTHAKLVELYASWLLAGDERTIGFPDSLPVGLSKQEMVQAVLVAASKTGTSLSTQAQSWSLDITIDSARTLALQLIADKRIPSSDSAKLFPPPTIRVEASLSIDTGIVVGGAPVGIHGSFAWNPGLGPVTIRAQILRGTEFVAGSAITTSLIPVPVGASTHASLDSAGSILIATPLATEGDYQLVLVAKVAGGDSAKATVNFHVGPKASSQPGVPSVRLYSPTDGSTVPFETRQIATTWVVTTPQGAIDTVTIDGVAAKAINDSMWSGSVALSPTGKGQTVVLRAHSNSGLATTQVATFTRQADLTGPVITWISPTADLEVENGVTGIVVRVKATDPSGIDTVLIAGQKPDSLNASGEWVRKVPIPVTGSPMAIVVRAVDSAKNASVSSVNVTRQNPSTDVAPVVVLVSPAAKTGTVVIWDSAYATVRWTITDPYGIDSGSVRINGIAAVSEPGNNWSARVPLAATGAPTSIALAVKNKNGVSGGDVVAITRREDTTKPVLTVVAGSRDVGFDSAEVRVTCKASDNDSLRYVEIGGVPATLQDGVYSVKLKIEVGDSRYSIVARDRSQNATSREVVFHRYQKMTIERLSPKQDTIVPFTFTTLPVSWAVAGAKSAWVGDNPAVCSNGRCTYQVPLSTASTRVFFWATDSANKMDSNVVTITRRDQATLALSYGKDTLATLPDSVVIAATSETGATLAWSLDGTTWTPFTGSFAQKTSGTAQVRAQVTGKDDKIASLKAFMLYHANHAPTIVLTSSGLLVKSYAGTFSANVVKVTDWGAGDGVQTGTWEVQVDPVSRTLLTGVAIGSNGSFSGNFPIDTSATAKVRFRIRDSGGNSQGGVDTSDWTPWLAISIVDTVLDRDGNIYGARRMPDGRIWMRSNLHTKPTSGYGVVIDGNTTFGFGYTWAQATNQDAACDTSCKVAIPAKGLCPTDWSMADTIDWRKLEESITVGSTDSAAYAALRAGAGWKMTNSQYGLFFDTTVYSAVDKFGFNLYAKQSWSPFAGNHGTATVNGAAIWTPEGLMLFGQDFQMIWSGMVPSSYDWNQGALVRCLKDP